MGGEKPQASATLRTAPRSPRPWHPHANRALRPSHSRSPRVSRRAQHPSHPLPTQLDLRAAQPAAHARSDREIAGRRQNPFPARRRKRELNAPIGEQTSVDASNLHPIRLDRTGAQPAVDRGVGREIALLRQHPLAAANLLPAELGAPISQPPRHNPPATRLRRRPRARLTQPGRHIGRAVVDHPAGCRASYAHGAGMARADADRAILARRRLRLAVECVAPAFDRARLAQSATVPPARAERAEAPRRRVCLAGPVPSPALDRARLAQPAGVEPAGAERAEAPRRRVRFAVVIPSPALDRAGLEQRAGVALAGAERAEAPRRRACLAVAVASPALDRHRSRAARTCACCPR